MRFKKATELASQILGDPQDIVLPVDVKKIVKKNKIILIEIPHENTDLSGTIVKNGNKTLIVINALDSEIRQRFTLAHELGHFFLHKNKDVYVDRAINLNVSFIKYRRKTKVYDPEEAEANAFAAELLMPKKLISKDFMRLYSVFEESLGKVQKLQIDFIIKALAEKYKVSLEAMRIRIEHLEHDLANA
jgi:Zn-dependent peptidase ImmA (M78 family)